MYWDIHYHPPGIPRFPGTSDQRARLKKKYRNPDEEKQKKIKPENHERCWIAFHLQTVGNHVHDYTPHEVIILQLLFSGGAYPFSTHCSSNSSSAEQTIFCSPVVPSLLQASMRQDEKGLSASGSCDFVIQSTQFLKGFSSEVFIINPQAFESLNFSVCCAVQAEKAGVGPHLQRNYKCKTVYHFPFSVSKYTGTLTTTFLSLSNTNPTKHTRITDSVRLQPGSCLRFGCIYLLLVSPKHPFR